MGDKPLLIYDGDCGFCRFWIEKWRTRTGEKIDYQPYQKVCADYPDLSKEQCEKSVWLVEPGGERLSGAKAVFRALDLGGANRWTTHLGYRFYLRLPGFGRMAEWVYAFIAKRRRFFSFLTRLFYGKEALPSSHAIGANLFVKALAVISAIAFLSFATQALGLIGSNGIAPAHLYLEQLAENYGSERFTQFPTLFWLNPTDNFLMLLCLGGVLLSLLLLTGICQPLILFLLWADYLSLVTIGRLFANYQWDNLLLESLILALFLVPWRLRMNPLKNFRPSRLALILVWLLVFKLMFSSGAAKLASGDESWRGLTAMVYHYTTQPLPNFFSYSLSHLPLWFHQFEVILVFFVELVLPLTIFMPRRLRHSGGLFLIGFQLLIMLSGNYGFFNLLSIALCLTLFDDRFWSKKKLQTLLTAGRAGQVGSFSFLIVFVFLTVTVSAFQILRTVDRDGKIPSWLKETMIAIDPYRSINHYGLFAVMTKSRPEITIEGSLDGYTWEAYEFKWKPGLPERKPPFLVGHMPRLDWQMWFASLGNLQQNAWLTGLAYHLMQNTPEVVNLLGKNPFEYSPPDYVRAVIATYRFTDVKTRRETGKWWEVEGELVYMPPLSYKMFETQ